MRSFLKKYLILPATAAVIISLTVISCVGGNVAGKRSGITGEHTHWYGTVASVDKCHAGKYNIRCNVFVEGRAEPYRLDLSDYPGSMLQRGDRIGYTHRERDGSYEVLNRRNDFLMPAGKCYFPQLCLARYNSEHGYSK